MRSSKCSFGEISYRFGALCVLVQGDLDLRGETVSAQNAPMFRMSRHSTYKRAYHLQDFFRCHGILYYWMGRGNPFSINTFVIALS